MLRGTRFCRTTGQFNNSDTQFLFLLISSKLCMEPPCRFLLHWLGSTQTLGHTSLQQRLITYRRVVKQQVTEYKTSSCSPPENTHKQEINHTHMFFFLVVFNSCSLTATYCYKWSHLGPFMSNNSVYFLIFLHILLLFIESYFFQTQVWQL